MVAFSGGTDSTLLLALCRENLGKDRVLAVTADSATLPRKELAETRRLTKELDAQHLVICTDELADERFAVNPNERCYYCKNELFTKLGAVASDQGYEHIVYGATKDDLQDYRPGLCAAEDTGTRAPLLEAGLTKQEVRELSARLNLPTAEKPAAACLASRIPYGTRITKENLSQVEQAEDILKLEYDFSRVRVRHHGTIARIEIPPADFSRLLSNHLCEQIISRLKQLGFIYVTLDLEGLRSGSMNEVLKNK